MGRLSTVVYDSERTEAAGHTIHERCSSAAKYRRYFGSGPRKGDRGLRHLLTPALGRSLIAVEPGGDVVALGNLMYDGDAGELALLVRDDWQRQGVGSALARKLIERADGSGRHDY